MNNIYCGNNQLDEDLINGNSLLGTRLGCIRKGIGRGLRMPYNKKFKGPFLPISNRNIYCGDSNILPNGYESFGANFECLQKGIGIGQRQKAIQGFIPIFINYLIFLLILLILCTIICLSIYYIRPSFATKINEITGEKEIDMNKYISICSHLCFIIFIIMFLICYKFFSYRFV
jgi:hypothetical protein